MALMSCEDQDSFHADLGFIKETVRARVDPVYAQKTDGHWDIWVDYCSIFKINPYIDGVGDPIPYLQIFAY